MNKENQDYFPMHKEDFDSFDGACARSDAKLMAVMDSCRPRFQTSEDFQKEQVAHYAREAMEATEATAAKVKAETSSEIFRRISQACDAKMVKAATSAAKKSVKQKKTKRLTSYYAKKY
jgi:DhnA family fructose-bisphosphate aldolase class Ia